MGEQVVHLPIVGNRQAEALRAGDCVLLNGVVLAIRCAAHKRLDELIRRGRPLPIDLSGQVMYCNGHSTSGATAAESMGLYMPQLMRMGLKGMIGHGTHPPPVLQALRGFGAVYMAAAGGSRSRIAESIKEVEVVAYPDLGSEAIERLHIEGFPAVVVIDTRGGNVYHTYSGV